MSGDDNDIRIALGALTHAMRDLRAAVQDIGARVDDLGAMAARTVRLDQLGDDFEHVIGCIPGALREAATQPMIAPLAGPSLHDLADQVERELARRRGQRVDAPAIESEAPRWE